MTMTNNQLPVILRTLLGKIYGDSYKMLPKFHDKVFKTVNTDKAINQDTEIAGFGLFQDKDQGAKMASDTITQETQFLHTLVAKSLSYTLTKEAREDGLSENLVSMCARQFAKSVALTRDTAAADLFNNGFSTNREDGVPLFSASHPNRVGTYSNIITAADLSEESLEDMHIAIMEATDPRGLESLITPKDLLIATAEVHNAHRILKSVSRVGTTDNDTNALKDMGMIKDVIVCRQFTDADAFFVTTDAENGFTRLVKNEVEFNEGMDDRTLNMFYGAYMREAMTVTDARAAWGSAGA